MDLIQPVTLASIVAVLGGLVAFMRWVWPKWRAFFTKVDAGLTAVIGHEEIRDPGNPEHVVMKARPGLGVWMATTDASLGVLSTAVQALAEQHAQLDDHEGRIKRLEAGAVERIVARVESTAAFDAMGRVADGSSGSADAAPAAEPPELD